MSLPRVIAAMKAAGCSPEQIGLAVLSYSDGSRSSGAERQAKFRARQKAQKGTDIPLAPSEQPSAVPMNNVTNNVLDNVTSDSDSNAESDASQASRDPSLARAFSIGEEDSIYTLENATHSIPTGGAELVSRAKGRRASRLSEAFLPSPSMRNYAKRHGWSDAEIDREGEKMRDWSLSARAGAKLDWEATWRGWVTRRIEQMPPARAGPNGSHAYPREAAFTPRTQALKDLLDEHLARAEQDTDETSGPDASGG
jgi:hypothetical protein